MVKHDGGRRVSDFKTRLVTGGFQQRDLMYKDLYSPLAKLKTCLTVQFCNWLRFKSVFVVHTKINQKFLCLYLSTVISQNVILGN